MIKVKQLCYYFQRKWRFKCHNTKRFLGGGHIGGVAGKLWGIDCCHLVTFQVDSFFIGGCCYKILL